jgi:hypothetical protein
MRNFFIVFILLLQFDLLAQPLRSSAEIRMNYTSDVPFWMRSNTFGSVPLEGLSSSVIGNFYKDYEKSNGFDWGVGFEGRGDFGKKSRFTLIEGYTKLKYGPFEVRGGRVKEFQGLVDSTLSIGSFSMSGSALGIPKIELRVPEYWPKNTLISGKGNFAHGWYGNMPTMGTLAETDTMKTYFHQKSLWVRLARPDWNLKLYGGFVDNAFWGDEYKLHSSFNLSPFQRYWSVVSGKVWQGSKVGNHVGNIDLRADYHTERIKYSIYRQFFYEVGALWHLANIQDGLVGLSINNIKNSKDNHWKKILLELIYTKNQAGEPWSKPTPTGNENYLNHYIYNLGWSYRSMSIGVPLITARNDAKQSLPYNDLEYYVNNRLWGLNLGSDLMIANHSITAKLTYSKNFGTRRTQADFPTVQQFSWILKVSKNFKEQYYYGLDIAGDHGQLLPNSLGISFNIKKIIF